jgi:hypothetical protein
VLSVAMILKLSTPELPQPGGQQPVRHPSSNDGYGNAGLSEA